MLQLTDFEPRLCQQTIFAETIGRTDLATSAPEQMQDTLNRLTGYNFKILCPGHE